MSFLANPSPSPGTRLRSVSWYLFLLCLLALAGSILLPGPPFAQGAAGPQDPGLSAREEKRFYDSLEFLLDHHGNLPEKWPAIPEREEVVRYLKERLDVSTIECRFGRNLLGYGRSESRRQAIRDLQRGRVDGFGTPYDIILASSRYRVGFLDSLASVALNQGLAVYNKELEDSVFVVLKADLHSQFGDVFRNFNGLKIRILAREINFLGCPGSAAEDYQSTLGQALAAADVLRARIYVCQDDDIPQIIPQSFNESFRSKTGISLPDPSPARPPMEPLESMSLEKIVLPGCDHNLESYLSLMSQYGSSLLKPDRSP